MLGTDTGFIGSIGRDDIGDFFRAFRHDHAVGWLRGMDRLIAAMLQAVRLALRETLLKLLLEGVDQVGRKCVAHVRNRVAWSRSV